MIKSINGQDISLSIKQDGSPKLESKQLEIYQGLKAIGPEISSFYLDSIFILNSKNLITKSYILAHIAREIESGLKSILAHRDMINEKKKENTENKFSHLSAIALSLGLDEDNHLVKRWFNVAKKFHKFAHQHGAMKEPRHEDIFLPLWKEFEDILRNLLGSYYNLLDRIDRIIKYETPTKEVIATLPNLFKIESRYSYFFSNLKSPKWLSPLYEAGFFNPEKNPLPIEDPDNKGFFSIPHWPILTYLENVATINQENPSEVYSNLLMKIIENIVDYRDEHGNRIDNSRTDWFLVKILFLLPIDKISEKHIDYIELMICSRWQMTLIESEIVETVLPKLISNSSTELILRLLNIILDYNEPEKGTSDEFTSIMEKYWLEKAIKENKISIAKLCGIEAGQIAISIIHEIIQIDNSQFNTIWIPTIEDHPQKRFPDRYECQLVHFVRDMFELANPNNIKEIVKKMLVDDHSIFQRISLHIISFHYDSLMDLFWEWKKNPLENYLIVHEVYELFNNNCTKFTDRQIEQILEWIESKEYFISESYKDMSNKILAYRKKAWITSLLPSKNQLILSAYDKYNKIDPKKVEHPGFVTWSSSMIGSISPISQNQLLAMPIQEIADYLTNFKEESGWGKPSIDGLSDVLRNCISENPKKFSEDLKRFLNVQRVYQYSILRGFVEAWRKQNDFLWNNLLNFIIQIIDTEKFWSEKYEETINDYRKWIISQIADLIEDGTKNDDHAFDPKLLPIAESILFKLINHTDYDMFFSHNLVTSVLNSSKGRILSAMINYSLRSARLSEKTKDRWIPAIKREFDKRLHKEIKPSIEFYVTLSKYLPNLLYLDKKWVIDNINFIFPIDSDEYWEASFTGYLFYSSSIYNDLYFLLRDNHHYEKAINFEFTDKEINKALVPHICIGYIEGWEDIDDPNSLISKLLNQHNIIHLLEIVNFFWISHENQSDSLKTKVIEMWRALFNLLSNIEDKKEYKEVISDLSKWLVFIDKIDDEILKWILLSVKYIKVNYNTSFFVEYLVKHASITPDKVADIYLFMLNEKIFPVYDQKNIKVTIQSLYDQKQKDKANEICNFYGRNGFDLLRAIYSKNN
ncbi:MAG: hypothetical protein KAU01_06920 [Candidatus Cloacimonetes bacterium]|nr:hypothetical protein [Candidatus Cloacimonadota bacterium]